MAKSDKAKRKKSKLLLVLLILSVLTTIGVFVYASYIEMENKENDIATVSLLNGYIEEYLLDDEIDKTRIMASDIRSIINEAASLTINFKPNHDQNHFWFNLESNQVELLTLDAVRNKELLEQPDLIALSYKPEAVYYPYILLDDDGNYFSKTVNSFYLQSNYNDGFINIINLINKCNDYEQVYFSEVLNFNLFISSDNKYSYSQDEKENIIVATDVTAINTNYFSDTDFTHLYFPSHVTSISDDSFSNTSKLKLVSFNGYINNLLQSNYINNYFRNSGVMIKGGLILVKDESIEGEIDDSPNLVMSGNGTLEDPYQVVNIHQFNIIDNYSSTYFILMNDLYLDNVEAMTTVFNNVLDGNNKTLSYFILETNHGGNYSIFNEIGEEGVIKNLNITNINVSVNIGGEETVADLYLGSICTINNGLIENVKVSGIFSLNNNILNKIYIGGLAAVNKGDIKQSTANITIDITSSSTICYVGGIVGYNNGNLVYLANDGKINVGGNNINIGGIAGYTSVIDKELVHDGFINRNYVTYKIDAQGNVGGIFGYAKGIKDYKLRINNAVNLEAQNKRKGIIGVNNGNIVGEVYGSDLVIITNFYTDYVASNTLIVAAGAATESNRVFDELLSTLDQEMAILNYNSSKILYNGNLVSIFKYKDSVIKLFFE